MFFAVFVFDSLWDRRFLDRDSSRRAEGFPDAGLWRDAENDIMKAFTLRFVRDVSESCKLIDVCLELSNGRCPTGMFMLMPWAWPDAFAYGYDMGWYIRIGVGSNVVCSTGMGMQEP